MYNGVPRWSAGGWHYNHVGRKARLDAFGKMISITEVCNSDAASVEGFKAFYVAKEGNSGGVHVRHNLMSCLSSSSDMSLHRVVATPTYPPKRASLARATAPRHLTNTTAGGLKYCLLYVISKIFCLFFLGSTQITTSLIDWFGLPRFPQEIIHVSIMV